MHSRTPATFSRLATWPQGDRGVSVSRKRSQKVPRLVAEVSSVPSRRSTSFVLQGTGVPGKGTPPLESREALIQLKPSSLCPKAGGVSSGALRQWLASQPLLCQCSDLTRLTQQELQRYYASGKFQINAIFSPKHFLKKRQQALCLGMENSLPLIYVLEQGL